MPSRCLGDVAADLSRASPLMLRDAAPGSLSPRSRPMAACPPGRWRAAVAQSGRRACGAAAGEMRGRVQPQGQLHPLRAVTIRTRRQNGGVSRRGATQNYRWPRTYSVASRLALLLRAERSRILSLPPSSRQQLDGGGAHRGRASPGAVWACRHLCHPGLRTRRAASQPARRCPALHGPDPHTGADIVHARACGGLPGAQRQRSSRRPTVPVRRRPNRVPGVGALSAIAQPALAAFPSFYRSATDPRSPCPPYPPRPAPWWPTTGDCKAMAEREPSTVIYIHNERTRHRFARDARERPDSHGRHGDSALPPGGVAASAIRQRERAVGRGRSGGARPAFYGSGPAVRRTGKPVSGKPVWGKSGSPRPWSRCRWPWRSPSATLHSHWPQRWDWTSASTTHCS